MRNLIKPKSQSAGIYSPWILVISVAALMISTAAIAVVMTGLTQQRVAYVRSGDLIEKSDLFQKMTMRFQAEQKELKANVDTLQSEFVRNIGAYNSAMGGLSKSERTHRESMLTSERSALDAYASAAKNKVAMREAELKDSLVLMINAVVQRYGEVEGYDIILATSSEGSLLYADKAIDVTDDILNSMGRSDQ